MNVVIHQPDYIPYLGLFYKFSKADVFVFLDDCQYSNNNTHNWNRIKTPQGECRLKFPVEQHLGDLIKNVRTKDELGWKQKHLKTLEMNYKRAPYFDSIYPVFREKLLKDYNNLADMNIEINTWLAREFGFKAKICRSSELGIQTVNEERVIDIVKRFHGDVYISGLGAMAYEKEDHFVAQGIRLIYTDYKPIEYKQLWEKAGFLPNMSVLDYIFNCGFAWEYVLKEVNRINESA